MCTFLVSQKLFIFQIKCQIHKPHVSSFKYFSIFKNFCTKKSGKDSFRKPQELVLNQHNCI